MSRVLFLFILPICAVWHVGAQDVNRDPDPQATQILIDLDSKIDLSQAVLYHFTLELDFPAQDPVIQEGTLLQSGDKYNLQVTEYGFVTDGRTSHWVIDRQNREIQIHDYIPPSAEELTSPQALLKIYNNESFDYQLIDSRPDGTNIIEFKPLLKGTDYTKARLTLSDSKLINEIELFNRDGSRYLLTIQDIDLQPEVDDKDFVLDLTMFKGYHVEDLRID